MSSSSFHVQIRQGFLQLLDSRVGDLRAVERHGPQASESLQAGQAGIGDVRSAQVQVRQLGHGLQMVEPAVGDPCPLQAEIPQVREIFEAGQVGVGDRGVIEGEELQFVHLRR